MDHDRIRTDGGAQRLTDLGGQVALISGGTDGIGKATATKLAEDGATTVLVGSTPSKGRAAVEDITTETGNDDVEYLQANLARVAEVERLAETVRSAFARLDVLVHTAGIVPYEQEITADGIERSFAINYLSRFLLTTRLEDRLREGGPTRVVNVAAAGQNTVDKLDLDDLRGDRLFTDPTGSDRMVKGQGALEQAQVANDLFSIELADRLAGAGVGVSVVNPGAVDTDIRLKANEGWRKADEKIRSEDGVLPPEQVAETIRQLATVTEPTTTNGRFYGPDGAEIEVPDGVADPDLRARLWERSDELATTAQQA